MSQSLLNKIWSFLTLLLLYLCLNVWSITQQWQLSFPGNPFKVENVTPNGATIYGVPICGMLLILVSVVTRIYASRSTGPRWKTDCRASAISLLIRRSATRRPFRSSCCA